MTSSEQGELSGFDQNTEYRIQRDPDLTTITQGAEITYRCQWAGLGEQPTVARGDYNGPRDGVHWYTYSAQPPRHLWQNQLRSMDVGFTWRNTWQDDPGLYSVIALIRSESSPDAYPTRCAVSQQIGDTGNILRESLDALVAEGELPSVAAVKAQTDKYLVTLKEIEDRFPISDLRKKERHDKTVAQWGAYRDGLAAVIKKTDGKRRIPLRGLHIETATQIKRPLFLVLVDMGDVQRMQPGGYLAPAKKWLLIDWTNAENPRFRGEFGGEGDTAKEAIVCALNDWDWSNRYPKGHVTYELPAELQSLLGGPARRQMDTNGKNLNEEIVEVLGWITVGAMVVSGACALFTTVRSLGARLFAAALVSSTGGAVLSIAERRHQGVFDWRADVVDGLTIVGNVVGAGAWARGARVKALDQFGKKADYIFLGTRVGTDSATGVLVAEEHFQRLDAIGKDPDLLPEERARQLLSVMSELTALGMMTYFSMKATGRELDHLETKVAHLTEQQVSSPDQLKSTKERLDTLVDKQGKLNFVDPPVSEGHTSKPQTAVDARAKAGRHKTTVKVVEVHTPPPRVLDAEETDLAKAFLDDGTWKTRRFSKSDIILLDQDGYRFYATCENGTLDINVELANPKKDPPRSRFMKAKELYPLMYDFFERQGNRVERLTATWAKTNFEDAKKVFDAQILEGKSKAEAEFEAVQHARTYKSYHARQGLTKVVSAEYHETFFSAEFERQEGDAGK